MGQRVRFECGGASELTLPAGEQPAPAVIVCHEWFGLNDDMRRVASRLSDEKYMALAIDFFDGRSTTSTAEAIRLANELETPRALQALSAAADFLRGHPRCTGKVGVVGFCLGGAMALAAASNLDSLSCVVPFYGLPLPRYFDAEAVEVPVQGHYARADEFVRRERVEAIWQELIATPAEAQLYFYEAGHAFMRESDPTVYEPEDAEVAWGRMISFLHRHLVA